MDEKTFERAVAVTRQQFLSRPELREIRAETYARHYRKVLPKNGRDDFLRNLIVESAESKMAWDAVKLITEDLLRTKEPLPAELREWLADVLYDQQRPGKDKRQARPTKGGLPRSRVLLDTRLIHDSWRKGCRDERTKARGGFGGGCP